MSSFSKKLKWIHHFVIDKIVQTEWIIVPNVLLINIERLKLDKNVQAFNCTCYMYSAVDKSL